MKTFEVTIKGYARVVIDADSKEDAEQLVAGEGNFWNWECDEWTAEELASEEAAEQCLRHGAENLRAS